MSTDTVADYTLDLRGESCPYPVIYTLDSLKEMEKGNILLVITDCPSSFRNVPEEVVRRGYQMVEEPRRNGQENIFMIRA